MEPQDPNANPTSPTGDSPPQRNAPPTNTPQRDMRHGPSMVVVRSSVVPMVLMLMLCIFLGIALIVSVIFNIYSAAAYAEYFQTDPNIQEAFHSGTQFADKKIAIISLTGMIMQGDGFTKRQIDRVRDDDRVEAVVLRVDSPGGSVSGTDYIYHHLKRLRDEKKVPIVVSMGSMAASGGYYASMACSNEERVIFCEPTGITGSIGVIIPRYDLSEMLEKIHVEDESIVSHPYKEMMSMTKEMTPEERRRVQQLVDEMFNRFKDIVREGRPQFANDEEALNQVATGEVFTGQQAKDLMLVDDVGFIEDAIERAAELAKLNSDDYSVVEFKRPATLADALTGGVAQSHPLGSEQIFEMTTPRAYYLYSGLPGFVPQ